MNHYFKSVIPVIESNYNKFTTVEKSIADFFINNQKKADFSAKAVALKLFVSEASLSRFAQKCGYRVEKKETMAGNTLMILNAYQELLNSSYSLVDEKQIERIGNYLNKAKKVLVCGKGSSGLAAKEMEIRFMRIGVDVDSITDTDLMRMRAVFQDEDSLVFGFSIGGQKEEIIFLLKEAKKRGAKTILFTANNRDDYKEFCTEVVLVPSLLHLNHGNVISPQFPILIMTDIIYSYYVERDETKKKMLHERTLQALEKSYAEKIERK